MLFFFLFFFFVCLFSNVRPMIVLIKQQSYSLPTQLHKSEPWNKKNSRLAWFIMKEKIKVFSLEVRCPKNLDLQREKAYVN